MPVQTAEPSSWHVEIKQCGPLPRFHAKTLDHCHSHCCNQVDWGMQSTELCFWCRTEHGDNSSCMYLQHGIQGHGILALPFQRHPLVRGAQPGLHIIPIHLPLQAFPQLCSLSRTCCWCCTGLPSPSCSCPGCIAGARDGVSLSCCCCCLGGCKRLWAGWGGGVRKQLGRGGSGALEGVF